MSEQMENLYRVQKKDIRKAGVVLADAFQHDSVWRLFFQSQAKLDVSVCLVQREVAFLFWPSGVLFFDKV